MIFSVEIWEHIFIHIDPVSLTHLKIICKCWKEIIDKMLQVNNFYYNFNLFTEYLNVYLCIYTYTVINV